MTWKGPNIVVFTDVTISPPYKVENVIGNRESREFVYVTKIVDKFVRDQQAAAIAATTQLANNYASGVDIDGGHESAQSVSPVSSLSSNTTTSAAGSIGNNTTAASSSGTTAAGASGPGQGGASAATATATPSPVSAN